MNGLERDTEIWLNRVQVMKRYLDATGDAISGADFHHALVMLLNLDHETAHLKSALIPYTSRRRRDDEPPAP